MAVSVDQDIDAASLPVTAESIDGPVPTGVAYFQVDNLTEGEPVTFTVTSDANTTWGLVVVEGERDGSAMGQGLEWTPEASSLLVGVLSFGKDGFDADARLNQASFTLEISGAEEGDSGDTGETDDGSGDGGGGGGGGGAGGGKGCGCASPSGATPFGGTVQPGLLGLLLAGLALRRRARDDDRA
jgi:MYXO-CTERM domain-containing protein